MIRHDKEYNYTPVRVKGEKGDVILPAGLAMKIYVHLDSGKKIPLTEMKKKERTRLSEGEAARIWGSWGNEPDAQFFCQKKSDIFCQKDLKFRFH